MTMTMTITMTRLLLCLLFLVEICTSAISLCSSQNTGSTSGVKSAYQSNGACTLTCAGYSYAILQGEVCWCSNTMPGSTVEVSDCSDDCSGYPYDKCGNLDEGYYAYIELAEASSTAAESFSGTPASSSTLSSSASPTSTSTSSSTTSTLSTSRMSTRTSASTRGTSSSTQLPSSTQSTTTTSSSSSTTTTTPPSSSSAAASSIEASAASTSSAPVSSTTSSTSSTSSTTSIASSSSKTSTSTSTSSISSSSSSSTQAATSIIYSVKTITGSAQTQVTTTLVVSTVVSLPTSSTSQSSSTATSNAGASASGTQQKSSKGYWDSPGKVAGTFVPVGVVCAAIIGVILWCCLFRKRHTNDEDEDAESLGTNEKGTTASGYPSPIPASAGAAGEDPFQFVQVDQRLDPKKMYMNWESGSRASLADDMDYSRRVLRVTNA